MELSRNVLEVLLTSHHIQRDTAISGGLFKKKISTITGSLKCASNHYGELGVSSENELTVEVAKNFLPRALKSAESKKKRTVEKAEVFTPLWLTIKQIEQVDTVPAGRFGKFEKDGITWVPTRNQVFPIFNIDALVYIKSPRLEITCGEAPYLVHRYDTLTGQEIPLLDDYGRFARTGILDRKLRVVSEVATPSNWLELAYAALESTFGYEWQGDSLFLARKAILETFIDYYEDFFETTPSDEKILKAADIISWRLWQMDGLKKVVPDTCTANCVACKSKTRKGHDGISPAIKWVDGKILNASEL